jgi:hypothetical protein
MSVHQVLSPFGTLSQTSILLDVDSDSPGSGTCMHHLIDRAGGSFSWGAIPKRKVLGFRVVGIAANSLQYEDRQVVA